MRLLEGIDWLVFIFAAGLVAAQAADFDGSKPLLCAVISITECTPNDGCQKTTLEEHRDAAVSQG